MGQGSGMIALLVIFIFFILLIVVVNTMLWVTMEKRKFFNYKNIKNNDKDTFLRRLTFYFKKGSIKIHLITGNDSPEYHTHPWDFTSLILFGGYWEFTVWNNPNDPDNLLRAFEIRTYHVGEFNKKLHTQKHRVELFKLWGYTVPCLTIGWYSHKKQLCSFCKELGYCKSDGKPEGAVPEAKDLVEV